MNVLECYQRKRELVFEDDVVALCRSVLVIFVLIYRNLARGPFAKVLRDIIGTKTEPSCCRGRCRIAAPTPLQLSGTAYPRRHASASSCRSP
jgi:hypothetical protein